MKLSEKIQEIKGNPLLFVGSKSSFIFIGLKSEIREGTDEADHHYFGMIEESVRRAYDRYEKNTQLGRKREARTDLEEYQKAYDKMQAYTPLMDRDVKDTYKRITDAGQVIIIEGEECGYYWTREEAEAKEGKTCMY